MCVRVLCMYMYHNSVIYVAKKICYLAICNQIYIHVQLYLCAALYFTFAVISMHPRGRLRMNMQFLPIFYITPVMQ